MFNICNSISSGIRSAGQWASNHLPQARTVINQVALGAIGLSAAGSYLRNDSVVGETFVKIFSYIAYAACGLSLATLRSPNCIVITSIGANACMGAIMCATFDPDIHLSSRIIIAGTLGAIKTYLFDRMVDRMQEPLLQNQDPPAFIDPRIGFPQTGG